MKRFISTLTGIAMAVGAMAIPADVTFTYAKDDIGSWGTLRKESYDVAMRINNPSLAGKKISSVRVMLNTADGLSDGSIWLSKELNLKDKANNPDIISYATEILPASDGKIQYAELTVKFPTPYEITESGVYVGYSFKVDGELNDLTKNPLLLSSSEDSNSFYLHTSTQVRNWMNYQETRLAAAPLIFVTLSGDFPQSAIAIKDVQSDIFLEKEKPGSIAMSLTNLGIEAIESIDYIYEADGLKKSGHQDFTNPLAANPASTHNVTLPIEPFSSIGTLEMNIEIDKVNGIPNEDDNRYGTTKLHISPLTPVHRAVMEEFTGTWCQWCPKGWIAMKIMNELHPENFIGLAYHYDDPMMTINEFPVEVFGFPSAYLDRMKSIDPYDGSGKYTGDLSIEQDWLEACKKPTSIDINAEATWTDEEYSSIDVKSHTLFVTDLEDIDYRLSYILVQNNMSGNTLPWFQKNAYSGTIEDGYLSELCDMPSLLTDIVYDDVVLISKDMHGIENSLPSSVKIGDEIVHSYRFNLADAKSTCHESAGEYLIQDPDNLAVVVMAIDNKTNRIINANKTALPPTAGVDAITDSAKVVYTSFHDLSGKTVDSSFKGFMIKTTIFDNGSIKTSKVFAR